MLLILLRSLAADPGLYDPAPPPDSAFVRVANASGSPVDGKVGPASWSGVEVGLSGPYRAVKQGKRPATLGSVATQELVFEAGSYYTIAVYDDRSAVLVDEPLDNMAKAQIVLYNLSEAPLVSLKTTEGAQAVVADVAPDGQGQRLVNPISAELSVFAGETLVVELPAMGLQQGKSYSVLVTGPADAPRATAAPASTQTGP